MAGIVRKIDELGRIVIPKEIRRTMRIREGEDLEMVQVSDNEIVLKKYSQLQELKNIATSYATALSEKCGVQIMIVDKGQVLAHQGGGKDKSGEQISNTLFSVLQDGEQTMKKKDVHITKNDRTHYQDVFIYPVMVKDRLYGGIIAVGDITKEIKANIELVGTCLANQLE